MIFGSGFDVLRSEKSQVEKFLPFTVLPKLRIGSNLTQSCMFKGWWECLKTFGIVCWYLVVSFLFFGVWRGVSFDMGDILGCQSCLGLFETHSMRDSVWLEPTHQFDPTLKNKMFFHLTLLRHQNIKTSLSAISKNYWVLQCFLYFVSVREKLQSTVSLDHPVEAYNICQVKISAKWDQLNYGRIRQPVSFQ